MRLSRDREMTRKSQDEERREVPSDPDEIEIIEIEGMDDAGARNGRDEVDVVFEEPPQASGPREDTASRERLMRLQADFENLRKRIEREQAEFRAIATIRLVTELLPVLDNFDRAIASERLEGENAAFRAGVELIHRQLAEALKKEGLRPVDALGRPFDPAIHEAVATAKATGIPENTVIDEIQRGYFLRERLLRPALVRVSVGGEAGAGDDGSREVR
jgi:molecular chaperone GrpE